MRFCLILRFWLILKFFQLKPPHLWTWLIRRYRNVLYIIHCHVARFTRFWFKLKTCSIQSYISSYSKSNNKYSNYSSTKCLLQIIQHVKVVNGNVERECKWVRGTVVVTCRCRRRQIKVNGQAEWLIRRITPFTELSVKFNEG